MPAIIAHHIFGEDVVAALPQGLLTGEEELIAFLLGNQGADPFFSRFCGLPAQVAACHRLAAQMHGGRVTRALLALRDGVSHLPLADEHIGRAFALGVVSHYALDRTAHPFVFWQQDALIAADPSLTPARREIHALIESDLDSWTLWEKRHAMVEERPAATNLMRTERIDRVAGALFSQVAFAVFGIQLGAGEYAAATRDYELVCRAIEPAGSTQLAAIGAAERLVRGRSMAWAMTHYVRRTSDCAAANLDRRAWENPFTHERSYASFADLFEQARIDFSPLAEAFVRGDEKTLRRLVGGLNYEGRPVDDD